MDNEQAMAALVTQERAIDEAKNALTRFIQEKDRWPAKVKVTQMAEIKSFASKGGADLSTWDGKAPPPRPEVDESEE